MYVSMKRQRRMRKKKQEMERLNRVKAYKWAIRAISLSPIKISEDQEDKLLELVDDYSIIELCDMTYEVNLKDKLGNTISSLFYDSYIDKIEFTTLNI